MHNIKITDKPNTYDLTVDHRIGNLKILIAEDDEVSKELIVITIEGFAREVIIVDNGYEAVEACQKNPDIDLVLMDIKMPVMDGLEATRQIRTFNRSVIIIAQTAFAFPVDRENAIVSGCNDYITKPIKKDGLLGIMNSYFTKG